MKALVILMALVLGGAACGALARERVLIPAMEVALDRVIAPAIAAAPMDDVRREIVDEMLGGLRAALSSGDADQVLILWSALEPYAQAGVDARVTLGEIGQGVAGSFRETFDLFGLRAEQL